MAKVSDDPDEAESDSGNSLFITQKPVPEAVRSVKRRHSRLRSDPTSPREREGSEDADTSSQSESSLSHPAKSSKKGRRRRCKTHKLKKYHFPFLGKIYYDKPRSGREKTQRGSKLTVQQNAVLQNSSVGGFFECVKAQWKANERGYTLESLLPMVELDKEETISPLSEEDERSYDKDIKVVERKCFATSSKAKCSQAWYTPSSTERTNNINGNRVKQPTRASAEIIKRVTLRGSPHKMSKESDTAIKRESNKLTGADACHPDDNQSGQPEDGSGIGETHDPLLCFPDLMSDYVNDLACKKGKIIEKGDRATGQGIEVLSNREGQDAGTCVNVEMAEVEETPGLSEDNQEPLVPQSNGDMQCSGEKRRTNSSSHDDKILWQEERSVEFLQHENGMTDHSVSQPEHIQQEDENGDVELNVRTQERRKKKRKRLRENDDVVVELPSDTVGGPAEEDAAMLSENDDVVELLSDAVGGPAKEDAAMLRENDDVVELLSDAVGGPAKEDAAMLRENDDVVELPSDVVDRPAKEDAAMLWENDDVVVVELPSDAVGGPVKEDAAMLRENDDVVVVELPSDAVGEPAKEEAEMQKKKKKRKRLRENDDIVVVELPSDAVGGPAEEDTAMLRENDDVVVELPSDAVGKPANEDAEMKKKKKKRKRLRENDDVVVVELPSDAVGGPVKEDAAMLRENDDVVELPSDVVDRPVKEDAAMLRENDDDVVVVELPSDAVGGPAEEDTAMLRENDDVVVVELPSDAVGKPAKEDAEMKKKKKKRKRLRENDDVVVVELPSDAVGGPAEEDAAMLRENDDVVVVELPSDAVGEPAKEDAEMQNKKKKRKRLRENDDVVELPSDAVGEPAKEDAEMQKKKKKRKRLRENDDVVVVELPSDAVGEPAKEDAEMQKKKKKRKRLRENDDVVVVELPSDAVGEPAKEDAEMQKKKKKRKKERHAISKKQEEELSLTLNLDPPQKLTGWSEGSGGPTPTQSLEKNEGSQVKIQKTTNVELVPKKKKRKKSTELSASNLPGGTVEQSDDSVQKREKKGSSSFLVDDTVEQDAETHQETSASSVVVFGKSRQKHKKKLFVNACDFEAEPVEKVEHSEESVTGSSDAVREKTRKKKKKASSSQDGELKGHEEDLKKPSDKCQGEGNSGSETTGVKKKKKKHEKNGAGQESAADTGCSQSDETVVLKKKKKKKCKDLCSELQEITPTRVENVESQTSTPTKRRESSIPLDSENTRGLAVEIDQGKGSSKQMLKKKMKKSVTDVEVEAAGASDNPVSHAVKKKKCADVLPEGTLSSTELEPHAKKKNKKKKKKEGINVMFDGSVLSESKPPPHVEASSSSDSVKNKKHAKNKRWLHNPNQDFLATCGWT